MRGLTRADIFACGTIVLLAALGAVLALAGQPALSLVAVVSLLATIGLLLVGIHRNAKRQGGTILRIVSNVDSDTKAAAATLTRVNDRLRRLDRRTAELSTHVADLALRFEPVPGGIQNVETRTKALARDLYDLHLTVEEFYETPEERPRRNSVAPTSALPDVNR